MSIELSVNLNTKKKRMAYLASCGVTSDLQWLDIDPIIADKMLQLNARNRPFKSNSILTFTRSMNKGEWAVGPDMITFDSDGILSNGQNRLQSIIDSGTTQRFAVAVGVEPFADMDTGMKRSAYDLICMCNLGDPTTQNPKVVGCVQAMTRRKLKRGHKISNQEVVDVYMQWQPHLKQMVTVLDTRIGDVSMNCALMAAYLNGVPYSIIDEFKIEYIKENSQRPVHGPILALRDFCRNLQGQGTDQLMSTKYNATQWALDEFMKGTCATQVPYGIPNSIWEYDVTFLNKAPNGTSVTARYFR